jgi:transcriptional regulator with XRE-family HTH domain
MVILEIFGSNVKMLRLERNISQEKFAEMCGLHRTYISDIERYKRSISLGNVEKIAEALNIEIYKLFMEKSNGQ